MNREQKIKHDEEEFFKERGEFKKKERTLIERKANLREETIMKQYIEFSKTLSEDTCECVYLNKVLLHSAIVSYYYDIHRYKNFSGSGWANHHKQAAYTIKWIVRFRPIQINDKTEEVTREIFDINLKFALTCGFAFLRRETVDLIMQEHSAVQSVNKAKREKKYSSYEKLLYDLRYRHLSGKKLVLVFEALELVSEAKSISFFSELEDLS
jgi:hypothetical protein